MNPDPRRTCEIFKGIKIPERVVRTADNELDWIQARKERADSGGMAESKSFELERLKALPSHRPW